MPLNILSLDFAVTAAVISIAVFTLVIWLTPKQQPAVQQESIEPERTKSVAERRAYDERKAHKQTSPSARKTHRVDTDCGPVTVTVVGDLANPRKILTYHDIYSDHRTAFNTFFQAAEGNELLSEFTVLHVDAPGHEDGAEARHPNMPYPSAEDLAQQLCAVVKQLKLGRFTVIGCGYGANILARYCALQPQQVTAAVLVGLHTGKPSMSDSLLLPFLFWLANWQETYPTLLRARIRARLFSPYAVTDQAQVVQAAEEAIERRPRVNQQLLARSALRRSFVPGADLLLLRDKPVLLVVSAKMDGGYESAQKAVNFIGGQASMLRMYNAGTLALEEFPDRLMEPIQFLLEGAGYRASSQRE